MRTHVVAVTVRAELSSLHTGDIIEALDGGAVTDAAQLEARLREDSDRERSVPLGLVRNGKRMTLNMAIGPLQEVTWEDRGPLPRTGPEK